jgi:integrase
MFKKPGLTITTFRRMYISKTDDCLQNKSWAEKKEIARAMGHAVTTQERVYYVKPEFNKDNCFTSDDDSSSNNSFSDE